MRGRSARTRWLPYGDCDVKGQHHINKPNYAFATKIIAHLHAGNNRERELGEVHVIQEHLRDVFFTTAAKVSAIQPSTHNCHQDITVATARLPPKSKKNNSHSHLNSRHSARTFTSKTHVNCLQILRCQPLILFNLGHKLLPVTGLTNSVKFIKIYLVTWESSTISQYDLHRHIARYQTQLVLGVV